MFKRLAYITVSVLLFCPSSETEVVAYFYCAFGRPFTDHVTKHKSHRLSMKPKTPVPNPPACTDYFTVEIKTAT